MKIVDLNSDIVPRFGTRKPNEREYTDCANILENSSRPPTPQQRLIEISKKRRTKIIYRDLLFLCLLAVTVYALLVAANVFVIVIWPVKIVIGAAIVLMWFFFWLSGLE